MKLLKVLLKVILVIAGLLLLAYGALYIAYRGDYTVAKTVAQDPSIPHVTLNNVTFHSQTFGNDSNQVVIVLHGGPGNDFKYLLDLQRLADDYFVVFYDQRGTGLSPRVPAEQLNLENMIDDLHNIVLHYGKSGKVNIIGHSWGGMLATAYVARFPETINKLVLAEPGPLMPDSAKKYGAEAQLQLSWALVKHLTRCYFESRHVEEIDDQARMDYFFQQFVSNREIKDHPMAGYFCNQDIKNAKFDYWRFSGLTSYEIMMRGMQGDFSTMNFGENVDVFKNKVLFLSGACDILVGPEFQKHQVGLFYDTESVVLENTGHFMFSEQPEAAVAAVRAYLASE